MDALKRNARFRPLLNDADKVDDRFASVYRAVKRFGIVDVACDRLNVRRIGEFCLRCQGALKRVFHARLPTASAACTAR